ncbi:MAG: AraC family transcriptional regulator [Kiritimatiellae bacterium]|nr:AraC family transcriptional regulator [Kiritimatiellia bacterium]
MQNLYFDDPLLAVLLHMRSWHLMSSVVADRAWIKSSRHRRWMLTHQHAHAYTEVMIALSGKTVYGINRRIYPCGPGSVFLIDPSVPHDITYPSWTLPQSHLWIAFMQDKAMARLMTFRQGRLRVQVKIHCLLDLKDATLWRLGALSSIAAGLPPELIRLRLLAALADVVFALVKEGYRKTAANQRHRFQQEKIEAICRHIRETGGVGASLDHLAQIAGYSKFHFLYLFQQHTGQSVHEYVNQSRLRKVEVLLARGMALKAIAAELGFSCPAAFSHWYRPFRKKRRPDSTAMASFL